MIPLSPIIYDWLAQIRWPWLALYFRASEVEYRAARAARQPRQ